MMAYSMAICFNLLTVKCGYNLFQANRETACNLDTAVNMTFRKRPPADAALSTIQQ